MLSYDIIVPQSDMSGGGTWFLKAVWTSCRESGSAFRTCKCKQMQCV